MSERHRLLRRQLARHFGAGIPADLEPLLADIDQAYRQADEDRQLVERSLELTSRELIERHEELRMALDSASVGTWSWRPAADLTIGEGYPNPLFPGASPRFVGAARDLFGAVHPHDRAGLRALLEQTIGTQAELRTEIRILGAADRVRWVSMRGQASLDHDRISGVVMDVTAQRSAWEDAGRRSLRTEQLWRALLELTRGVAHGSQDLDDDLSRVCEISAGALDLGQTSIWIFDDGSRELRCREVYSRTSDRRAKGTTIREVDHPAYFEALGQSRITATSDASADPRARSLGSFGARLDAPIVLGGRLAGIVCCEEQPGPRAWTPEEQTFAGSVADHVAVLLESERRHNAESDLVKQRSFLRQVIDLNPHLIFAKDRDGRFTLVNQAVAEVYGTTVDELLGKRDADFNPDAEQVRAFLEADRKVMEDGRERSIPEEQITDAGGRLRWLQTVKRPIFDPSGEATQILGVATDITERKAVEGERSRLEDELRQAQRIESIGVLAGGVAHDFNNLLTPILGCAEEGSSALQLGDPLRELFMEVLTAGRRAKDLTSQLLAFGRKQMLDLRPFDLNAEVESSARILTRLVPEHVRIELSLSPDIGLVVADPVQIQQVLLNLVINARDAMPEGGRLSISTGRTVDEGGEWVILRVRDSGLGIPPEVLPRIFEPFFTTKALGRGTGLGLSTVYGVVQQHGGTINVESGVPNGTCFVIKLPASLRSSRTTPSAARAATPGARNESVLVVEDEPNVLRVVQRTLKKRGFFVVTAADGNEALAAARSLDRPLDLLLTDVIMPGLNGREVYQHLRASSPQLRVLFMSGHDQEVLGSNGVLDDGVRLLRKPFTGLELVAKVQEALEL